MPKSVTKFFTIKQRQRKLDMRIKPSTAIANLATPPPKQRNVEALLENKEKQVMLQDAFEMKKIWDINNPKYKRIHEVIMVMIAMDESFA